MPTYNEVISIKDDLEKVSADFMKNTGSRKIPDKKVDFLWQSLKSVVRLSTSVDSLRRKNVTKSYTRF
jgi:hypothetical protein